MTLLFLVFLTSSVLFALAISRATRRLLRVRPDTVSDAEFLSAREAEREEEHRRLLESLIARAVDQRLPEMTEKATLLALQRIRQELPGLLLRLLPARSDIKYRTNIAMPEIRILTYAGQQYSGTSRIGQAQGIAQEHRK